MNGNILVLDDEKSLAEAIRIRLEIEGFRVEVAHCAREARELMKRVTFDLLLLDVNLPEENGFDFCRSIQQEGCAAPVIFITTRGKIKDKLEGLQIGADDYLCKPFNFDEMIARVNSKLRREEIHKKHIEMIVRERWEEIEEGFKLLEDVQLSRRSLVASTDIEAGAQFIPFGRVGGDFWKVFDLENGNVGIVVGDTMGKGLTACLLGAYTVSLVNRFSKGPTSPKELLKKIEHILDQDFPHLQDSLVSIFYGVFSVPDKTLTYVCAGHPPPILLRKKTKKHIFLSSRDRCLISGLPYPQDYTEKSVFIEEGDKLILYSDGITELRNSAHIYIDLKKLYRVLLKNFHLPSQLLAKLVIGELESFAEVFRDDVTLVILEPFPIKAV